MRKSTIGFALLTAFACGVSASADEESSSPSESKDRPQQELPLKLAIPDDHDAPARRKGRATDGDIHPKDRPAIEALYKLGWKPLEKGNLGLGDKGHVVKLELYGPKGVEVTDPWLLPLRELSELRALYLSRTKITDTGLADLPGLSNLRDLSLAYTSISDKGLEHIARLSDLQRLEVTGTRVTKAGLKTLREKVPGLLIVSDDDPEHRQSRANNPLVPKLSEADQPSHTLVGRLRVHSKFHYRYYIDGFGDGQECALFGADERLSQIELGRLIQIRGQLASRFFGGDPNDKTPALISTWIIYMDVGDVQMLPDEKR